MEAVGKHDLSAPPEGVQVRRYIRLQTLDECANPLHSPWAHGVIKLVYLSRGQGMLKGAGIPAMIQRLIQSLPDQQAHAARCCHALRFIFEAMASLVQSCM